MQSKKNFLVFFCFIIVCSCGDRDLTRNSVEEPSTSESDIFNVKKVINGYAGLLNFENFEYFDMQININSNRLNLDNSSEGVINCSAESCSVEWLEPPGPEEPLLSNKDRLKKNYTITITTQDVDFFVNRAPVINTPITVCDASAGDLEIGTKITISLLFRDTVISQALIFELGEPNNNASLPTPDKDGIKRDARYYLDFDSFFDGDLEVFDHTNAHFTSENSTFFVMTASTESDSKSIRVCTNDNDF